MFPPAICRNQSLAGVLEEHELIFSRFSGEIEIVSGRPFISPSISCQRSSQSLNPWLICCSGMCSAANKKSIRRRFVDTAKRQVLWILSLFNRRFGTWSTVGTKRSVRKKPTVNLIINESSGLFLSTPLNTVPIHWTSFTSVSRNSSES